MAYTPHVINLSHVEDMIKVIVIIGIKRIMYSITHISYCEMVCIQNI